MGKPISESGENSDAEGCRKPNPGEVSVDFAIVFILKFIEILKKNFLFGRILTPDHGLSD